MEAVVEKEGLQVHVRYQGESIDYTGRELDVGDLSTDQEVKEAVAHQLGIQINVLNNYTIDRSESNAIVVRPEAEFG
jgi:hypothetical protein